MGGDATPSSPGSSSGYPPPSPHGPSPRYLIAATAPAALLAAQQLRDGQRGCVRLVGGGGQAHGGAGTAAVAQSGRGGAEEASAGYPAERRAAVPQSAGIAEAAQRGTRRGEQTSRMAPPHRHSAGSGVCAPMRACGAAEPRPLGVEGRALACGSVADPEKSRFRRPGSLTPPRGANNAQVRTGSGG